MASDHSKAIAGVYAQAIFELADEQRQSQVLRSDLAAITEAIRANPDLAVFLKSPAINRDQKIASLSRIFADKLSGLTMNFLKVLAAKDRLSLMVKIYNCFVELEDKKAGFVKGSLTTAVQLSEKEQVRLTEQISQVLGKKLTLETKVDPSIIGGMILALEGTVIDASVRSTLQQFLCKLREKAFQKLPPGHELYVD